MTDITARKKIKEIKNFSCKKLPDKKVSPLISNYFSHIENNLYIILGLLKEGEEKI